MRSDSYAYILASQRNGTLYVGSTTELARRVWEHEHGVLPDFTRRYGVTSLVWYEGYQNVAIAGQREYGIERWRRAWKLELIEAINPIWRDLYEDLDG